MSARLTDLQVHRFPSPASLSFVPPSLPATTESLCAVNSILDNSFYYALTYLLSKVLSGEFNLPPVLVLIMGCIRD